jgi:NADH-quinone oxidoreductase subunit J
MGLEAAFWILAILAVGAALAVVSVKNVFRAALSLIGLFIVIAGLYITLSADFLAAVQVLVYVGAISVLIILAIMLTRRVQTGSQTNKLKAPAIIVAILVLGVISYAVAATQWNVSSVPPLQPTTSAIADRLFSEGGFILPVEISAVLLLTAIMGAIILAKENDK